MIDKLRKEMMSKEEAINPDEQDVSLSESTNRTPLAYGAPFTTTTMTTNTNTVEANSIPYNHPNGSDVSPIGNEENNTTRMEKAERFVPFDGNKLKQSMREALDGRQHEEEHYEDESADIPNPLHPPSQISPIKQQSEGKKGEAEDDSAEELRKILLAEQDAEAANNATSSSFSPLPFTPSSEPKTPLISSFSSESSLKEMEKEGDEEDSAEELRKMLLAEQEEEERAHAPPTRAFTFSNNNTPIQSPYTNPPSILKAPPEEPCTPGNECKVDDKESDSVEELRRQLLEEERRDALANTNKIIPHSSTSILTPNEGAKMKNEEEETDSVEELRRQLMEEERLEALANRAPTPAGTPLTHQVPDTPPPNLFW